MIWRIEKAMGFLLFLSAVILTAMSAENLYAQSGLPTNSVSIGQGDGSGGQTTEEDRTKRILQYKETFESSKDKREKQFSAIFLLNLGEKDEKYFNYLAEHAKNSLKNDKPFPFKFGEDGKMILRVYTENFLLWAEQHKIDPDVAAYEAYYNDVHDISRLARTHDSRGYDILIEALNSPNYTIVAQAAKGLAGIGDKRAIEHIRSAAVKAPHDMKLLIMHALLYFDDIEAQNAINEIMAGDKNLDPVLLETFKQGAQREKEQWKTRKQTTPVP
jgi:hypothetical protein